MRLLKRLPSGGFDVISFNSDDIPEYAILSHTWTEGQEITYDELLAGSGKDKTGYEKTRFCGDQAAADRLEYFWVDTCCIQNVNSTNNYLHKWVPHTPSHVQKNYFMYQAYIISIKLRCLQYGANE